jgi:DNA (cytosine-5)-methyltransferase 1
MIYDGYNNKVKEDNIVGTITQHCSRSGMTNGFKVIEPMIVAQRGRYNEDGTTSQQLEPNQNGTTNTLTAVQKDNMVTDGYRIRRLTPIECERLQGFPDDHTSLGNYDGETKPMSNTQRYKQCGNAVTVDVVEAVAKRCIPLF